jgi:phosphodiesterase/alkaline phosphatase D-like protein
MNEPALSRRRFLQSAAAGGPGLAAAWRAPSAAAADSARRPPGPGRITRLGDHLAVRARVWQKIEPTRQP